MAYQLVFFKKGLCISLVAAFYGHFQKWIC